MDSCKYQRVKVNIAFNKALDYTSKMYVEDKTLNICSEFYLFFVFMGSPKGRKGCHRRAWNMPFVRLTIDGQGRVLWFLAFHWMQESFCWMLEQTEPSEVSHVW